MLLTNGSKYKIYDIEHVIRNDLVFKEPIPMTNSNILESLYDIIKYTTEFLEAYNIDYCICAGLLLGYYRHDGIIPWDNDIDIIIFKDGYYKLLKLIDKYNNNGHKLFHVIPGFKLFYKGKIYGELIVYDYNKENDKYMMSYPYINEKPTFAASITYDKEKFNESSLFPTKIVKFENFYVRIPNDEIDILINTYNEKLLDCVYYKYRNILHFIQTDYMFYIIRFIEICTVNKLFLFIYKLLIWITKYLINIK
jgi:hypothetical protein